MNANKVKKPIWKRWWVWVIVIFVIIMVTPSNDDKDKPVKKGDAPSAEATTEAPAKEVFEIGEEVQLDENILIVNSMKRLDKIGYNDPKSGKEYVVVNVTIKNGGTKDMSYASYDFKMQNSNGTIEENAIIISDDLDRLSTGELIPGGSVSGDLIFEQPKDDKALILRYEPGFWSDSEIKVNIK